MPVCIHCGDIGNRRSIRVPRYIHREWWPARGRKRLPKSDGGFCRQSDKLCIASPGPLRVLVRLNRRVVFRRCGRRPEIKASENSEAEHGGNNARHRKPPRRQTSIATCATDGSRTAATTTDRKKPSRGGLGTEASAELFGNSNGIIQRTPVSYRMQTNSPLAIRTARWPVCLRHQA